MPQNDSPHTAVLFSPYRLDGLVLPNRIVMTPMALSRARQPDNVPTQLDALYYSQRASAGLIVTEATRISPEGRGHAWTPGIYTEAQRDGWRLVTDAVHDAGGRIFLQLWHVGGVAHSPLQLDGGTPVAASAISDTSVHAINADGSPKKAPADLPQALDTTEIARIVDDFRHAAGLAMQAGFDGVEVHGGNGGLIDQFLRATANRRNDRYGGSIEGRVHFLAEVTRAVASEAGASRTGARLTPFITHEDMADSKIIDTILMVADVLEEQEITYLYLSEADWDDAPMVPDSLRESVRKRYADTIIMAGRDDYDRALDVLDAGYADLVAFSGPFVADPDLPQRLKLGLPLAKHRISTLVGGATGDIE